MREVHPEGAVTCQAVTAATAEDDVEHAQLFGHACCPTKEDVGNDKEFVLLLLVLVLVLGEEVLDEVFEGLFEGSGGFDEFDDEVVRHDVGVLGVWGEAVVGAGERDFEEVDGGVRWE